MGLAFTYYAPLVFVVAVSVGKEFVDELHRWRRDKQINSEEFVLADRTTVRASCISPGDVLVLQAGQRVPADGVVLQTASPEGVVYVRTDNLDGEVDWKTRRSIPVLQSQPYRQLDAQLGIIITREPDKVIDSFDATYAHYNSRTEELRQLVPLTYENAIYQNCTVASSECLLLVTAVGAKTKSSLNTSSPGIKEGRTDVQMNLFVKWLFVLLIVVAAVFTLASAERGMLVFMRFFVLYNNIIPLSLKVVLDIGKLLTSGGIAREKGVSCVQVNSTSIPEQLGRITHLLSDKTGTLTQNIMCVKKLAYGSRDLFTVGSRSIESTLATQSD